MTAVPCGEHGKHQRQRLCQARQEPGLGASLPKPLPDGDTFVAEPGQRLGSPCLLSHHLRRPVPSSCQPGLLPSLEMAPGRHPPRSALSQHGRCPPRLASCPHQTWRLPFTSHCARPPRPPRRLRRLQRARRKDGGSDCGRLNSREAAKAAHKGGGRRGSRAADPWIRCRGRTRRCRCRSRAGTEELRGGDALGSAGRVAGPGPPAADGLGGTSPALSALLLLPQRPPAAGHLPRGPPARPARPTR